MRIALDAMGTDRHPAVEVEGAVEALQAFPPDFEVVLVGDGPAIEAELARWPEAPEGRLTVRHTTQRIEAGDAAATAFRRKPDSSIAVGLGMQRDGAVDAFISAGSTGAVMAGSLFLLRRLPGVDRPAVATALPTAAEPCLLIDAGANIECKPAQLLQFARLGSVYVEDAWQKKAPRIGLLNIGEEPEKGDEITIETYGLLKSSDLNFVGNVEGRDVVRGACDVLVADGFVGNVLLKFYESVTAFFHGLLRDQVGHGVDRSVLDEIFRVFDWTQYGGAPLLGVRGISIICHGESPPRAIRNAIRVARQVAQTEMVTHIERAMAPAASGPVTA